MEVSHKTKEIKKDIKQNGEKKKISKDEMIKQLEQELEQLKITFHQKSGYLACLKDID